MPIGFDSNSLMQKWYQSVTGRSGGMKVWSQRNSVDFGTDAQKAAGDKIQKGMETIAKALSKIDERKTARQAAAPAPAETKETKDTNPGSNVPTGNASGAANGGSSSIHDSDLNIFAGWWSGMSHEQAAALAAKEAEYDPTGPTTIEDERFKTGEGRQEIEKDFDAILNGLREQYGEKEAMTRFNEIMAAEGWEIQEQIVDVTRGYVQQGIMGLSNRHAQMNVFSPSLDLMDLAREGAFKGDNSDCRVRLHSTLTATSINGQDEYVAATWASYNAYNAEDYYSAITAWRYENLDRLGEESGLDVRGMMESYSRRGTFGAQGVSTDLASVATDLLAKAGITLGEGQDATFSLRQNEKGEYTGIDAEFNFQLSDAEYKRVWGAIDAAVARDPSILQAFVEQSDSVPQADPSTFGEQYANGDQSLTFTQKRSFALSGNQPGAVVIGDSISIQAKSYIYQKKVADSFDPNLEADGYRITTKTAPDTGKTYTSTYDLVRDMNDPELATRMAQAIRAAKESGQVIEGTLSSEFFTAFMGYMKG